MHLYSAGPVADHYSPNGNVLYELHLLELALCWIKWCLDHYLLPSLFVEWHFNREDVVWQIHARDDCHHPGQISCRLKLFRAGVDDEPCPVIPKATVIKVCLWDRCAPATLDWVNK
jgi:hypothetical protein